MHVIVSPLGSQMYTVTFYTSIWF